VQLGADLLAWLLEPENPSARFLALANLLDRPPDDPDLNAAQSRIPTVDPARTILEAQFTGSGSARGPVGYWVKPDVGYSPKYRATVWQIIFLAQLGIGSIEPIRRACDFVLDQSRRILDRKGQPDGRFVAGRNARTAVNCLNGNLVWALRRFGYGDDPHVVAAQEATAHAALKRDFACHFNGGLPCAWGVIKLLRAFLEVPAGERSAELAETIERGVQFLLSASLPEAAFPSSYSVSKRWLRLGFPLAYHSDALEAMSVLAQAGQRSHPNVRAGEEWLRAKQDANGRWALEAEPGKMWARFGRVGKPNKWVTLRALRLLAWTS
jgi:hypothetical protein